MDFFHKAYKSYLVIVLLGLITAFFGFQKLARADIPEIGEVFSKARIPAEDFISVAQAAEILGISRIAVFKKVKKGQIPAERMGRSYAIPRSFFIAEQKKHETHD